MRLIAEQVKLLRERREALLKKREDIKAYYKNRDVRQGIEDIGGYQCFDYNNEVLISGYRKELADIEELLRESEFIAKRDTDKIDVGTGFSYEFEGEKDYAILIEGYVPALPSVILTSLDSDFGKAVLGHKEGDEVTYRVKSTGRVLSVKIGELDKIKSNYVNFLTSFELSDRKADSSEVRNEITTSQLELLAEENYKLRQNDSKRREEIREIIDTCKLVVPESDDKIEVGSRVKLTLMDGEDMKEKAFEFINHAVSTELDSHYVEEISSLGQSIKGLKQGDTFVCHNPEIKGVIDRVENVKEVENKKVF